MLVFSLFKFHFCDSLLSYFLRGELSFLLLLLFFFYLGLVIFNVSFVKLVLRFLCSKWFQEKQRSIFVLVPGGGARVFCECWDIRVSLKVKSYSFRVSRGMSL